VGIVVGWFKALDGGSGAWPGQGGESWWLKVRVLTSLSSTLVAWGRGRGGKEKVRLERDSISKLYYQVDECDNVEGQGGRWTMGRRTGGAAYRSFYWAVLFSNYTVHRRHSQTHARTLIPSILIIRRYDE
jgi:hypothetical protein